MSPSSAKTSIQPYRLSEDQSCLEKEEMFMNNDIDEEFSKTER